MPRLSKIGAAALAAFGWTGLSSVTANYLLVAGGGSGANGIGGGGGAGGLLTSTTTLNPTLSYTVIVGAGGAGAPASESYINGNTGSNTTAFGLTAYGGGYGGTYNNVGGNGGSGGGGGTDNKTGGTGVSGQGYAGGTSNNSYPQASGGGGGAGSTGANASGSTAGAGGVGVASSISGTSTYYAGGGGGSWNADASGGVGAGGNGGGTAGGNAAASLSASANTGGGSGGGGYYSLTPGNDCKGSGNGGSGIVIISYAGAQQFGGGVVTSVGGNTIHTFTTSGTLSPLSSLTASYLIVGGGGGGGAGLGGGGGAGGLLSGSGVGIDTNSIYLVTVGAGGLGSTSSSVVGSNGTSSAFSLVSTSSVGGGGGGSNVTPNGASGASGGGAAGAGPGGTGGAATQGFAGGNSPALSPYPAGGGGGAGAVGAAGSGTASGVGGVGVSSSISGTASFYAGGGGGGGNTTYGASAGAGGNGGGGSGNTSTAGTNATANTGGGGGGGGYAGSPSNGGNGGSGIVIISYPGSTPQMAGGTVTVAGGNVIHTFTSSGYLSPIVNVNNSLRFRQSASAYLTRTPSVASGQDQWTLSTWVKRSTGSFTTQYIIGGNTTTSGGTRNILTVEFSSDQLWIYAFNNSSGYYFQRTSTAVYRDPSAWYHLVVQFDPDNATSANKVIAYINGQQVSWGTSSDSGAAGSITSTSYRSINNTYRNDINGGYQGGGAPIYFGDGYLAEMIMVSGSIVSPNSFGAFNGQGVWQPVRYGGSYGTNGFYLPFNTNALGFAGSFNGSNQYLTISSSNQSIRNWTAAPWTIEYYVYANSFATGTNGGSLVIGDMNPTSGPQEYWSFGPRASGNVVFYYYNGASQSLVTGATLTTNQWYHLAFVQTGGIMYIYINGVLSASGAYAGTPQIDTSSIYPISIGALNGQYFNGSVSNIRITNSAVYTSNFTPSTSALTAISGTSLLTLQNATIIDNSTNALAITNNGSVATGQTYPFAYTIFSDRGPVGNNWTPNNISGQSGSTLDYMTDVPTNTSATVANYCTMNPLQQGSGVVLSQGNLNIATPGGAVSSKVLSTIGMTTGKWYCETIINSSASNYGNVGLGRFDTTFNSTSYLGNDTTSWCYAQDGNIYTNGTGTAYGNTYTAGDIIGIAFDADNGRMFFSKNGVFQNSGNPVTGTNPAVTGLTSGPYFFGQGASPSNVSFNFGQRPFAYTPPSGFVALNTFNLPTPTIGATPATTANKYFDVSLWTGNGTSQSITNSGLMQPDFVWMKNRSGSWNFPMPNSILGGTNILYSNSTDAIQTDNVITSFNSNGFTVGISGNANNNGNSFVGWQWNAGGSSVTNTSGSITSTVRANTTAGFSVVTYTGNSTNSTVGHGLGVAPSLIFVKDRSQGGTYRDWAVYSSVIGAGNAMYLNDTSASFSKPSYWNSTAATSTVFSLGTDITVNQSGDNYLAYCFAPIANYCAIGSYVGNGSTDGPFIFTGFRPRFLLIKRYSTSAGNAWVIWDTSRSSYNVADQILTPNNTNAENTGTLYVDLLSNGFKFRSFSNGSENASGESYLYMAIAESPFKYANAR